MEDTAPRQCEITSLPYKAGGRRVINTTPTLPASGLIITWRKGNVGQQKCCMLASPLQTDIHLTLLSWLYVNVIKRNSFIIVSPSSVRGQPTLAYEILSFISNCIIHSTFNHVMGQRTGTSWAPRLGIPEPGVKRLTLLQLQPPRPTLK